MWEDNDDLMIPTSEDYDVDYDSETTLINN